MAKARAELDTKTFEQSVLKYAKAIGDTTEQAVVRWGVQASRELAIVTAKFGGRGKGDASAKAAKDFQIAAIRQDALNVILAVDSAVKTPKSYKVTNQGKTYYVSDRKFLTSADAVNQWIRINRTARHRRTAKLENFEKRVTLRTTLDKAIKLRARAAGQAKGGWLDAGKKLATKQTGGDKIAIGKAYLAYAQKAGGKGSASLIRSDWNPAVELSNDVPHAASSHVISSGQAKKAINTALPAVLKGYRAALRRRLQKLK